MATNAKNLAELLNTDSTVAVGDIADGSVTTAKLAADAVTAAKLADDSVVTAMVVSVLRSSAIFFELLGIRFDTSPLFLNYLLVQKLLLVLLH